MNAAMFGDERLPARFWSKIQVCPERGCWIWTAKKSSRGYGWFWLDGCMRLAHRVAYEALIGRIPDGLCIDHVRMNTDPESCSTSCVNPAHMEPVTNSINMRRSPAGRIASRLGGLAMRKNQLPEGLTYVKGGRGVKAQICVPGIGTKHLGCRTPVTPEAIEELSSLYQQARDTVRQHNSS